MSGYIKERLEEKKKIEEDIKAAESVLQSKNMSIESINEHIKLSEELENHGLSAKDTDKVLNLLLNTKEYQFDAKKIAGKLSGIQRLEKKEKQLRGRCEMFTKQAAKYKSILPLVEEISALQIGVEELIAFKIAINQAVKMYNLPPLAATLRLIEDITLYNKIGGLNRELQKLSLRKFAITEACALQAQALVTAAKIQNQSI